MKIRWDKRIKAKHFRQFCIQRHKESTKILSKYKNILLKTIPTTNEGFIKMVENWDDGSRSTRDTKFISFFDVLLRPEEKNIININNALFQLTNSVENLLDSLLYLTSSKFQKKSTSDYRLIKYHIENYLNQNYIFLQRLKKYFDLLKKRFKKSNEFEKVEIINKHFNNIDQILSGIMKKRGFHVHDQDFRDFWLFVLMNICSAIESGMEVDKITYQSSVNTIKLFWAQQMMMYNKVLIANLDNIFKTFIEYGIQ